MIVFCRRLNVLAQEADFFLFEKKKFEEKKLRKNATTRNSLTGSDIRRSNENYTFKN